MLDHEFQASDVMTLSNATARTATFTSPVQDLKGRAGDLCLLQNVGAVSGTSPALVGVLEDSDDGSTGWATVAGSTLATVTSSNNTQKAVVQVGACKRYVRYTATIGGTTPSFLLATLLLARDKAE